jgi:hypothetical protein
VNPLAREAVKRRAPLRKRVAAKGKTKKHVVKMKGRAQKSRAAGMRKGRLFSKLTAVFFVWVRKEIVTSMGS